MLTCNGSAPDRFEVYVDLNGLPIVIDLVPERNIEPTFRIEVYFGQETVGFLFRLLRVENLMRMFGFRGRAGEDLIVRVLRPIEPKGCVC